MPTIRKSFLRIVSSVSMIMLVLLIAVPGNVSAYAVPEPASTVYQNDDFNHCSLNQGTNLWTFENPGNFPAATITGAFTGSSTLTLTVPPGKDADMSTQNKDAPRIMQKVTDSSFEVEVKWDNPLNQPPNGAWNMQGILIRDSSVQGQTKWLRFDFDTNNSTFNYFIGAVDTTGQLHSLVGPSSLSSTPAALFTTTPLYMDIIYTKGATPAQNTWSFSYRLGDTDIWHINKKTISGADLAGFMPTGFTTTDMGVFVGSTSTNPNIIPGLVSQVDYFWDPTPTPTIIDDQITLKVTNSGNGTVAQTCLPNTNQVSLKANPAAGFSFTNWTGLDSGTSTENPVIVTMSKSQNITANFTVGGTGTPPPVTAPHNYFIPDVNR